MTVEQPKRPRRFAPLDPAKRKEGDDRPVLKGIVFDVDGTLCMYFLLYFGSWFGGSVCQLVLVE